MEVETETLRRDLATQQTEADPRFAEPIMVCRRGQFNEASGFKPLNNL